MQGVEINAASSGQSFKFIEAASQDAVPNVEMVAYSGGKLRVNGYEHPVVLDVATLRMEPKNCPMLYCHKTDRGIGHYTEINASAGQVTAKGTFSLENGDSQQVLKGFRRGYPWQPSVGARPDPESVWLIPRGRTIRANGQNIEGPFYYAKHALLKEISIVPLGGDDKATAKLLAAQLGGGRRKQMDEELELLVIEAGLDPNEIKEEQLAFFQRVLTDKKKVEALGKNDPETDDQETKLFDKEKAKSNRRAADGEKLDLTKIEASIREEVFESLREEQAAEQRRIKDINALAAEHDARDLTCKVQGKTFNLVEHAIEAGLSPNDFAAEVLREKRHKVPGISTHGGADRASEEGLTLALLSRSGIKMGSSFFKNVEACHALGLPKFIYAAANDSDALHKALDAAHEYRDMSLVDICEEAIRLDGGYVKRNRSANIQAALSGATLNNVFTTNINTVVLKGFDEERDTTVGWTKSGEVPDFKQQDRIRLLTGMTGLKRHTKGKKAHHGTIGDKKESIQAARYSEEFVIDEQDIIDDLFNLLSEIPMKLGAQARKLRADIAYITLMSNPTMSDTVQCFHANHGNLLTSSGLSAATLAAAITSFFLRQENRQNLNLQPTHIVVPPALLLLAKQILTSAEIREAAAANGTVNVLQNIVSNIVSDSRLQNGIYNPTGAPDAAPPLVAGSATKWWLADATNPALEIVTLRGTGGVPVVSSGKLERGEWGVWYDVKYDVGAGFTEYLSIQEHRA